MWCCICFPEIAVLGDSTDFDTTIALVAMRNDSIWLFDYGWKLTCQFMWTPSGSRNIRKGFSCLMTQRLITCLSMGGTVGFSSAVVSRGDLD
jgi:hypothetical protein